MSLQKLTYELCKTVQNSPSIKDIKNLIQGLSINNNAIIFRQTVRSNFKYPKIQFLAYLLVAQQREEIEKETKHKMPILEDFEMQLLANCYGQLLELNRLCVSPIIKKFPKAELSIMPFNLAFQSSFYKKLPKAENDFELFDKKNVNDIVSSFQNHPAFKVFFETCELLQEEIDEMHYLLDVTKFSQDIIDSTPFNEPEWLSNEKILHKNYQIKNMLALVSLRDSLSNLNQLIFQAATEIDNKLVIFDEENIIDLSPTYINRVSSSLRVSCQTDLLRFLIAVEPLVLSSGVLVLLKDIYGHKGVSLGRVEKSRAGFMPGFGQFDIRLIDENLNSFPFILKNYDN